MRYQNQTAPRMAKRVPDLPWKEGFYWAKWCIPEDGTEGMGVDDEHFVRTNQWEVVEVHDALGESGDDFRVSVIGITRTQSIENFKWAQPCLPIAEPA